MVVARAAVVVGEDGVGEVEVGGAGVVVGGEVRRKRKIG